MPVGVLARGPQCIVFQLKCRSRHVRIISLLLMRLARSCTTKRPRGPDDNQHESECKCFARPRFQSWQRPAAALERGSLHGDSTQNRGYLRAEAPRAKAGGRDRRGRRRDIGTALCGLGIAGKDASVPGFCEVRRIAESPHVRCSARGRFCIVGRPSRGDPPKTHVERPALVMR